MSTSIPVSRNCLKLKLPMGSTDFCDDWVNSPTAASPNTPGGGDGDNREGVRIATDIIDKLRTRFLRELYLHGYFSCSVIMA